MSTYNTNFKLDLHDIDLIEKALQTQEQELSKQRLNLIADTATPDAAALNEVNKTLNDVHSLMGRLHNQKVFFRPTRKTYVSG